MKHEDLARGAAWSLDTSVYADLDNQSGFWCVFGNNSGFTYKNSLDEQQAKDYAAELNKNREDSKRYEEA